MMIEKYNLADNLIAVSVADDVRAWRRLRQRFEPFAVESDALPTLTIDVRGGELAESAAEQIYEPEWGGIGFITGRAMREDDGTLVLDFNHVDESELRVRMRISADPNRAEIVIAEKGDGTDRYFLTHAMMLAFVLATSGNGTLLIHASSVVCDGKGYLFQGKSGTGKSTHAALWVKNIAGAELLNDDNPLIRVSADGVAMVYGSPWSGKTDCYRNVSVPIGAMVRIVRSGENELRGLSPLRGYASLTPSVYFLPFMNDEQREARHRTIERLVGSVAVCEMHCRPDDEAAMVCHNGLNK